MRRTLGSILIDIVLVIIVIIGIILCVRVSKSRTTKEENIHNSNDQKLSVLVDEEEIEEVKEETTKEEKVVTTKEEKVVTNNKTNTTNTTKNNSTTKKNNSTTNKSASKNTITNKTTEVKKETKKENVENKQNIVVKEEEPVVKQEKKVTQEDVIKFFDKLENEIITSENIEKARVKVKSTFIKITDFIFYGTEINGYTFNGLTDEMKVRVLNFAAELDSHIEEYFPGYKETIKTDYNNFVIKLSAKYQEIESKVCAKIGTQTCENARLGLKLTSELIKSVTKSGIEALKTWYEKYRLTN